mmetsp:Transcript_16446/g.38676  ORF Transcript_16446/g.38676 Transcript_16446/m.38676 type:complete len:227 (+) Transcript_16446:966-1646(+)
MKPNDRITVANASCLVEHGLYASQRRLKLPRRVVAESKVWVQVRSRRQVQHEAKALLLCPRSIARQRCGLCVFDGLVVHEHSVEVLEEGWASENLLGQTTRRAAQLQSDSPRPPRRTRGRRHNQVCCLVDHNIEKASVRPRYCRVGGVAERRVLEPFREITLYALFLIVERNLGHGNDISDIGNNGERQLGQVGVGDEHRVQPAAFPARDGRERGRLSPDCTSRGR